MNAPRKNRFDEHSPADAWSADQGHFATDEGDDDGAATSGLRPRSTEKNVKHILVVDDEVLICTSLRRVLSRIGYRVTTETDPMKALTRIREAPSSYDVLIVDLTMPGMSGVALVREIRSSLVTRLPIILTTGSVSEPQAMGPLEPNVEVLMKPSTPEELTAAIARAFRARC
jgi:two-component system, cell cycle sensor histidine kinase and response regulator CckA